MKTRKCAKRGKTRKRGTKYGTKYGKKYGQTKKQRGGYDKRLIPIDDYDFLKNLLTVEPYKSMIYFTDYMKFLGSRYKGPSVKKFVGNYKFNINKKEYDQTLKLIKYMRSKYTEIEKNKETNRAEINQNTNMKKKEKEAVNKKEKEARWKAQLELDYKKCLGRFKDEDYCDSVVYGHPYKP